MELIKTETAYDGHFKLEKRTYKDGDKEITREVFNRGNVVAGIVYDTVKEKYIFVKQHRAPADGDMIEIVAGSMDVEGEKPEETMKREIVEEIGYRVDHMNHIRDFYSSPGGSSEITSLFYVEVSEQVTEGGGIGDEKIELIEVDSLGPMGTLFWEPDEQGNMLPPYQLIDAKSIIAVSYVEMNRILGDMANVLTQARMRSM